MPLKQSLPVPDIWPLLFPSFSHFAFVVPHPSYKMVPSLTPLIPNCAFRFRFLPPCAKFLPTRSDSQPELFKPVLASSAVDEREALWEGKCPKIQYFPTLLRQRQLEPDSEEKNILENFLENFPEMQFWFPDIRQPLIFPDSRKFFGPHFALQNWEGDLSTENMNIL